MLGCSSGGGASGGFVDAGHGATGGIGGKASTAGAPAVDGGGGVGGNASGAAGGTGGAGGSAMGGSAGAAGSDPCGGISCNQPPGDACISPDVLRTYWPSGTCAAGACDYPYADELCEFGCAQNSCLPDPCLGVTCASPPAKQCVSASTLRTYASSGACVGGKCEYVFTDQTCAFGCAGGACTPGACSGVVCNTPPAKVCVTSNTLKTYSSTGVCSNGTCSYSSIDQTCPFGCTNGACLSDPCASVTCNAPPVAACISGTTLRTYSAPGACSQGSCSYPFKDTVCASGCVQSACKQSGVWSPIAAAPLGRDEPSAVWTGSEMIVWGGTGADLYLSNSGHRYNPATNTWAAMSTVAAPQARHHHSAVWTGSKLIVWGGCDGVNVIKTGGVWDAGTDSWSPTMVSVNFPYSPTARRGHTAVWTGSEMIVWGGGGGHQVIASEFANAGGGTGSPEPGGRYDPATNSWKELSLIYAPVARYGHTAVWTGSEMIVWGGTNGGTNLFNDGGRYNPATNTWSSMSKVGAPHKRYAHNAVWTGTEMIVWGGITGFYNGVYQYGGAGGRYNPSTDTWTAIATTNAPAAREGFGAIWTGSEMMVWGGGWNDTTDWSMFLVAKDTGGRYAATTDTWSALPTTPGRRTGHAMIWTGSEAIVWGGREGNNVIYDSGYRFSP